MVVAAWQRLTCRLRPPDEEQDPSWGQVRQGGQLPRLVLSHR